MNAYIKFGEILSICSKDIERKPNSDINQGPKLCYQFAKNNRTGCPLLVGNEIPWLFTDFSLTKIHYSLTILPHFLAPYNRLLLPCFINTDIIM